MAGSKRQSPPPDQPRAGLKFALAVLITLALLGILVGQFLRKEPLDKWLLGVLLVIVLTFAGNLGDRALEALLGRFGGKGEE